MAFEEGEAWRESVLAGFRHLAVLRDLTGNISCTPWVSWILSSNFLTMIIWIPPNQQFIIVTALVFCMCQRETNICFRNFLTMSCSVVRLERPPQQWWGLPAELCLTLLCFELCRLGWEVCALR